MLMITVTEMIVVLKTMMKILMEKYKIIRRPNGPEAC